MTTYPKRAIGIFLDSQAVDDALNELKAANFSMEQVALITRRADQEEFAADATVSDRIDDKPVGATGAATDAITGATWGTLLLGMTSLALPGLGAVLAAGSLGAALVAGVAGLGITSANTHALIKAVQDWGIPEEQARFYVDRLIQGNYLMVVDGTAEQIDQAETILNRHKIHQWNVFEQIAARTA